MKEKYIVWSSDPRTHQTFADVVYAHTAHGAELAVLRMRGEYPTLDSSVVVDPFVSPMLVEQYIRQLELGLGRVRR